MKIVQSSSGSMPEMVDETSSPTTVYVRENVTPSTMQDSGGEPRPWFNFTEKQYERKEYEDWQIAEYVIGIEYELAVLKIEGGII